ncbi:MAG: DUF2325 domain-containing protein [Bacillota bacterium]
MSVLVIGGDRLGRIPDRLRNAGFAEVEHVTGRKKRDVLFRIAAHHDVVVVLTDFVNHGLARRIKEQAKDEGKHVVFARRSWSDISRALYPFGAH